MGWEDRIANYVGSEGWEMRSRFLVATRNLEVVSAYVDARGARYESQGAIYESLSRDEAESVVLAEWATLSTPQERLFPIIASHRYVRGG